MNTNSQLSASLEDYLEAIFWIVQSKGAARAKDIAKKLRVKASSVTGALQALSEKDYINYSPYDAVTLTSEGLEAAKKVVRRHRVLKEFFTSVLGINAEIADDGACKLEHNIPPSIVERLVEFMEFAEACPRSGKDWISNFLGQCGFPKNYNCEKCLEQNLEDFKKEKLIMQTKQEITTLADLKPRQKGVIVKINCRGPIAKRLADMGLGRGTLIEVERVAPLGDPIDIKIKGYHLSVRKDEATNISLKLE
jgi:DtxR family Mn-dependent transcriptional regulator